VSRVNSLALDKLTIAELLLPVSMGNDRFNRVYEARMPVLARPDADTATR
jgi:hypothetical protein